MVRAAKAYLSSLKTQISAQRRLASSHPDSQILPRPPTLVEGIADTVNDRRLSVVIEQFYRNNGATLQPICDVSSMRISQFPTRASEIFYRRLSEMHRSLI